MAEIMMEHPYGVYVREDDAGRIYAINSDAFIFNTQGWTEALLS